MKNQIRNLAISGVDTLEKANKVCEIVGDSSVIQQSELVCEDKWFFDDEESSRSFMFWWDMDDTNNFKNCTQMTYEEFLEKNDSKSDKDGDFEITDADRELKRDMENDSEPIAEEIAIDTMEKISDVTDMIKMKELYESEPDKWVVYSRNDERQHLGWARNKKPSWCPTFTYKLILKEHEHIADAVIANPDTDITYIVKEGTIIEPDFSEPFDDGGSRYTTGDFFGTYNADNEYQLPEPISANNTQTEDFVSFEEMTPEFEGEIETLRQTISIKDDNGKEYKFEKPEFECELLKVIKDNSGCNWIIGWYLEGKLADSIKWNADNGVCVFEEKNLTPIQLKWYDKHEQAYMVDDNGLISISRSKQQSKQMLENGLKLATQTDVDSIHYSGRE